MSATPTYPYYVDHPQLRKFDETQALVLLSMDSIAPFFRYIRVADIPTTGKFQRLLRQIITDQRAEVAYDLKAPPDLYQRTLEGLKWDMGKQTAEQFQYWMENVFIPVAAVITVPSYDTWYSMIGPVVRNCPDQWRAYGLPEHLSEQALLRARRDYSTDEINAVDDALENKPLSDWDLDMYARHGLYEEFKDPWIRIISMFRYLRHRQYMAWLVPQLSEAERETFQKNVRKAFEIENAKVKNTTLPDIMTQPLPPENAA